MSLRDLPIPIIALRQEDYTIMCGNVEYIR